MQRHVCCHVQKQPAHHHASAQALAGKATITSCMQCALWHSGTMAPTLASGRKCVLALPWRHGQFPMPCHAHLHANHDLGGVELRIGRTLGLTDHLRVNDCEEREGRQRGEALSHQTCRVAGTDCRSRCFVLQLRAATHRHCETPRSPCRPCAARPL
jgi:hypothetical protein